MKAKIFGVIISLFASAQIFSAPLIIKSDEEPSFSNPISQLATQCQFLETDFYKWTAELKNPHCFHRKLWELCYVAQVLSQENLLKPGSKGLAFGVGQEPLPSLFAKYGCKILATDQDILSAKQGGWVETSQYARNKASLNARHICDDESFNQLVELRNVDMNRIPSDLDGQFDFVWSCCSYEHLGSLRAGMEFVKNSIKCLKPGGIAVHTTEYNLSSNTNTITTGNTVIYRQRDMITLAQELIALGYEVAPLNFHRGNGQLDAHIDYPPYKTDPHIKLQIGKYQATSFGMIIKKPRTT